MNVAGVHLHAEDAEEQGGAELFVSGGLRPALQGHWDGGLEGHWRLADQGVFLPTANCGVLPAV